MAHDHGGHIELLDLDGDVLRSYWADAVTWVRRNATGPCRRILDLGAGTGNGSIALAHRFGDASVLAVDVDETMLERLRAKALELGLADRVRTLQFDLDSGWPDTGTLDVTWASLSLHHMADPDRVLRDVLTATRPGGLTAVAEMDGSLHFLPDDLAELEQRCLAAVAAELAEELPHLGVDWSDRLEKAGFTVVDERTFAVALDPPHSPAALRYAALSLSRTRHRFGARLSAADAAALDGLLDQNGPEPVLRRTDLRIRGARTVTLARKA